MSSYYRTWTDKKTGETRTSETLHIRYRDRNGKKVDHVALNENGEGTRNAKVAAEIEHREKFGAGAAPIGKSGDTNESLLEAHRTHLAINSASMLKAKAAQLDYWIAEFKDQRADEVTREAVNERILKLLKEKKLKPGTVRSYVGILKAAYNAKLEEHPVATMKCRLKSPKREVIWTEAELKVLTDNVPPWCKALCFVLIWTGMRLGDALRLKWAYIHEDHISFLQKKRDDAETQIKLSPPARAFFAAWRKAAKAAGAKAVYLFPGGCGPDGDNTRHSKTGYRSRESARHFLTIARKIAGCEHKHFHDMRRTYASQLHNDGSSNAQIARLLGQASTAMVPKYTVTEFQALEAANDSTWVKLPRVTDFHAFHASVLLPPRNPAQGNLNEYGGKQGGSKRPGRALEKRAK